MSIFTKIAHFFTGTPEEKDKAHQKADEIRSSKDEDKKPVVEKINTTDDISEESKKSKKPKKPDLKTRNENICKDKASGMTLDDLSKKYGLAKGTISKITRK